MKLIEKNIAAIARLCSIHQVKELYAFGSILTSKLDKNSDIDLLVNFEPIDLELYAGN